MPMDEHRFRALSGWLMLHWHIRRRFMFMPRRDHGSGASPCLRGARQGLQPRLNWTVWLSAGTSPVDTRSSAFLHLRAANKRSTSPLVRLLCCGIGVLPRSHAAARARKSRIAGASSYSVWIKLPYPMNGAEQKRELQYVEKKRGSS